MFRFITTTALILGLLGPAGAVCPKTKAGATVKVTGTNQIQVQLEQGRLHVSGPLPATGEIAGQQLAFGTAALDGARWWLSESLLFMTARVTGSGDHVDLSIQRLNLKGERGPVIPVPGVEACAAQTIANELGVAAKAAGEKVVSTAALFKNPAAFHGKVIRLKDARVTMQFEGNALWQRESNARFWVDADLPQGSYRVDAIGLFEADPKRGGYGHLGMSQGRWRVTRLLGSRPAGWTLGELLQRRVAHAAEVAFKDVKRATFGWSQRVSIPFPKAWPVKGDPIVCYYLYGHGESKAGDQHVGSVWGRACVDVRTPLAPVTIERLAAELKDLGTAPKPQSAMMARVGPAFLFLAVEDGGFADSELSAMKVYYQGWLKAFGVLAPSITPHHAALAAWLNEG